MVTAAILNELRLFITYRTRGHFHRPHPRKLAAQGFHLLLKESLYKKSTYPLGPHLLLGIVIHCQKAKALRIVTNNLV